MAKDHRNYSKKSLSHTPPLCHTHILWPPPRVGSTEKTGYKGDTHKHSLLMRSSVNPRPRPVFVVHSVTVLLCAPEFFFITRYNSYNIYLPILKWTTQWHLVSSWCSATITSCWLYLEEGRTHSLVTFPVTVLSPHCSSLLIFPAAPSFSAPLLLRAMGQVSLTGIYI